MSNTLLRRISFTMSILFFFVFLFFSFKTGAVIYSSGTDDLSAYETTDLTNINESGLKFIDVEQVFIFQKEYNLNELDKTIEDTNNYIDEVDYVLEDLKKEEEDIKKISIEYYTVIEGDSLYRIAKKIGQNIDVLVANNPEVGNGVIKIGQKLKILSENGIHYKVQKGDSLIKLAKRYGVKTDDIIKENNLETTTLFIGQRIFIKNPDLNFVKNDIKKQSNIKSNNVVSNNNFIWPIKWNGVTSSFGSRMHPVLKRYIFHAGVDLRAGVGTPIYAADDGKISYSGWASGYGNLIKIEHSRGYSTRYGHLDKLIAKQGSTVKRGELIGYSGKTGRVTGPHLHYEIRESDKPINPMKFR